MSFQDSLKKLKASREFKKFKQKNKNSFLFSAFFVLNSRFECETKQFDFYLTKKKAATFVVNDKIEFKTDEFHPKGKITVLNEKINIDIEKLKEITKKEIEKRNLTEFDINKIIIVLQKINEQQLWNVTCLMSSLKLLRMHIDCFDGRVLETKEESIVDFLSFQKRNEKS